MKRKPVYLVVNFVVNGETGNSNLGTEVFSNYDAAESRLRELILKYKNAGYKRQSKRVTNSLCSIKNYCFVDEKTTTTYAGYISLKPVYDSNKLNEVL